MTLQLDIDLHMWVVIAVMGAAMVSFAIERFSLEMTSLLALGFLLLWFQIAPLLGENGDPVLPPQVLLEGFANPSLLAVLALLVMGQGMIQTGALNGVTRMLVQATRNRRHLGAAGVFLGVLIVSAFLNNTPVVVMFIPIMQTIALRLDWAGSRLMMPLSFAAILGGMTTMIGSSTNLLVSSAMIDLGYDPLGMFEFTEIAVAMAAVGAVYVIFILPRVLPDRGTLAGSFVGEGKQFIAEIDITQESRLIGAKAMAGTFKALPDVTVRVIKRGEQIILPPFDDVTLRAGDELIVAATRQALTEALTRNAGYLLTHEGHDAMAAANGAARRPAERVLTEVMIAPASRMIDQTIDMIGFRRRFGCLVLGIQRRGRMARKRIGEIRLEAGDVLLVAGSRESVNGLTNNPDLLLMAWATRDLPEVRLAPYAVSIFLITVALAASHMLPIPVAAFLGATTMIATGCLNLRQAIRAIDRTILLLVGSALALGKALEATGGAQLLARLLIEGVGGADPLTNMAVLFLVVAIATNVLTNNACAVLFTPIGINLAFDLGIDPSIMAITVLLAANCSFATPIGYQTNLLVMGPGHYRFADFLRGGVPLVLLMWLVFCLLAPTYFGL